MSWDWICNCEFARPHPDNLTLFSRWTCPWCRQEFYVAPEVGIESGFTWDPMNYDLYARQIRGAVRLTANATGGYVPVHLLDSLAAVS